MSSHVVVKFDAHFGSNTAHTLPDVHWAGQAGYERVLVGVDMIVAPEMVGYYASEHTTHRWF